MKQMEMEMETTSTREELLKRIDVLSQALTRISCQADETYIRLIANEALYPSRKKENQ